jgi:hypothetical protein
MIIGGQCKMNMTQVSVMKNYAFDLMMKLNSMGEEVRDEVNYMNEADTNEERIRRRAHANILNTEYRTLQKVYDDILERIRIMENIEKKAYSEYTLKLLSLVEEGDTLSVSFKNGKESAKYYGEVVKLVGTTAIIKNTLEMELFDALAYPQVMDVNLERVWFYTLTKKDGTEYYA